MQSYTISANGEIMGTYRGENARDAIEAYARDAGYSGVAAAADALGQSEAEFVASASAVVEVAQ